MYELFVLGELMAGEKHGYLLQAILRNAAGPFRQISSGTLFPLLSRLVEDGWINLRLEEEQEGDRPRKIYEITDSGRTRFQELMANQLEHNTDTERIFHFKMVYFQYVAKDVRLGCLEQYVTYLQTNLKYVTDLESLIISQKPDPEKQRIQLLRMFDHRKHVGAADIEWIMKEIERIKAFED